MVSPESFGVNELPHEPVMLPNVLEAMQVKDGGVYMDATFGYGGYTGAMLDAAECRVLAFDRDREALARARYYEDRYGARFSFFGEAFGDAYSVLSDEYNGKLDGIVADIGVSSMQLDVAERGFSFMRDGALDMRMDRTQELSAHDIVNGYGERKIADMLYHYGGERKSRRIAAAIVKERQKQSIETTLQLSALIESVLGKSTRDKIHPATRSFQALRIAVNDELGELRRLLVASLSLLAPGGVLCVVSFQSLEDGHVKNFLRHATGHIAAGSRHMPQQSKTAAESLGESALFSSFSKKSITASDDEVSRNPRSRSARMRTAIRSDVPFDRGLASSFAERIWGEEFANV
jgi:16S rRNA (cytosine1402-N4)-methyltransferase